MPAKSQKKKKGLGVTYERQKKRGIKFLPVNCDVIFGLVDNINNDCISSVYVNCWSWVLSIHRQDGSIAAKSCVSSFFHLRQLLSSY